MASSPTRTRFVRPQVNAKMKQKSSQEVYSTKNSSYVSTLNSTAANARSRKTSKQKQNVHFGVQQQSEEANEYKQSISILPDIFQQFVQMESIYKCYKEG